MVLITTSREEGAEVEVEELSIVVKDIRVSQNSRRTIKQTPCLVVNPIKVNSFVYLFNCTTVGRASD